MTIRNQTVKINRGDTALLFVALTQADGTPYDPTVNAVIKWRLSRTSHTSEDRALVRKYLGNGITNVAAPIKGVNIALAAEDTDFFPGLYYHELKIWDNNDVMTAMTGTFIIKRVIGMGDRISPKGELAIDRKVPTRTP